MSPKAFEKAVQGHWAIKNCLRWALDVQIREDDLRNRRAAGPKNLAALRCTALNIVRQSDGKLLLQRCFWRAAQVPDYRIKLLGKTVNLSADF